PPVHPGRDAPLLLREERLIAAMPKCPQCSKPLRELVRRCPSCQADLDLLVDYVSHLQGGLQRAENLTRSGELGQAFWAYLEVLEVDPDNAAAKRQVGQVAAAVRQFDGVAPGRRWLSQIHGQEPIDPEKEKLRRYLRWILLCAALVAVFSIGYLLGSFAWNTVGNDGEREPPVLQ